LRPFESFAEESSVYQFLKSSFSQDIWSSAAKRRTSNRQ